MVVEDWAGDVDPTVPSAARMYDYFLGGTHNFAADREAARKVIAAIPDVPLIARVNRAFLGRAVRFLTGAGVGQFLDIGSGVPTVDNVHDLAPDARVVYADVDPVAVTHARQILEGNERAAAILADLRDPTDLLGQLDLLDLSQPVGLLLLSMLHFVPGEDAYRSVVALRDALAPGSHLVISHAVTEGFDARASGRVQTVYQGTTTPGDLRSRADVARFFDGYTLVSPGLVWIADWRPEDNADRRRVGLVAGVGR